MDPAEQYAGSILSRADLEFAVRAARSATDTAARTRRLNELDELFDWLPFDAECTRSYGIVTSTARASGARLRGGDALIAAQAHRHGAAVMTENVADFQPFDHVVQVLAPRRR
ncbi:PIN domain-containing protein [Cellulomonas sp. zg-ZUI40]|nr:PIN domain-containing protein [Cellulomonas dongxiuzhuiae]